MMGGSLGLVAARAVAGGAAAQLAHQGALARAQHARDQHRARLTAERSGPLLGKHVQIGLAGHVELVVGRALGAGLGGLIRHGSLHEGRLWTG